MNSLTPIEQDPKAEKILDAAKEAFLERGFADTSMDLVARRARASKTTLYTRFPSKETLFAAAIDRECRRRGLLVEPESLERLPIAEALFVFGQRFLELLSSPEAMRVQQIVAAEAPRFPELARLYYENGPARTIEAVAYLLGAAAHNGQVRDGDHVLMARQYLGLLKSHVECEMWKGCGLPLPTEHADTYLRHAVDLFIKGAAPR
jgi:TetR/AcrR family transcriptional repressor of mexJK operon